MTFSYAANRSAFKKISMVKKDPSVLCLWSSTLQLNEEQRSSLFAAIKNNFQLIQGPPGS